MDIDNATARGFLECVDVNTAGMIRASFGIYNTPDEVDRFLEILPKAIEMAKDDTLNYSRADERY